MATNNYRLAGVLLAASLVLIKCSCTEKIELDCTNVKYNFQLPVKALPDRDSIGIGDTIWLEINEPVVFKNSDGTMIDYSGAVNLGSAIGFSIWDNVLKKWGNAADSFSYILTTGIPVNNPNTKLIREYVFSEQNERYIFRLGVIPKARGLNSLLFSNSSNTYRGNDKCTKANFIINFKNTNQHYYLSPFYNGQANLVGGDYYFVVK